MGWILPSLLLWTHSIAQPKVAVTADGCWTVALDFGLIFAKFHLFGLLGWLVTAFQTFEGVKKFGFLAVFSQSANPAPLEGLHTLPLRRKMGYNSLVQKQQLNAPLLHHRQVSYIHQGATSGIQITLKGSGMCHIMNDYWWFRIQNFSNTKTPKASDV